MDSSRGTNYSKVINSSRESITYEIQLLFLQFLCVLAKGIGINNYYFWGMGPALATHIFNLKPNSNRHFTVKTREYIPCSVRRSRSRWAPSVWAPSSRAWRGRRRRSWRTLWSRGTRTSCASRTLSLTQGTSWEPRRRRSPWEWKENRLRIISSQI